MKYPVFRTLTCLTLTLSLSPLSALAAGPRAPMDFTDVPDNWSRPYISRCYELGLMSGKGAGIFAPAANLSLAEAIMTSVRMADLHAGGDGVVSQEGEHWYDQAVARAIRLGFLREGQFDSYTRPATRSELAGLLGRALPDTAYLPRNDISTLPDVTESTPYSSEIFRLYRAGILTGSDAYGTFHPYDNITRAELAALLCRLAQPDTRLDFTPAPKPRDLTVRSTDRKLYAMGLPLCGVMEIDGGYYISEEMLENLPHYFFQHDDDGYTYIPIDPDRYSDLLGRFRFLDPQLPAGSAAVGTATLTSESVNGVPNSVYTLDGRYPLLSLDALGAVARGQHFYLTDDFRITSDQEVDLVGQALPALMRSTPRETVRAIHDYVVNTMTYSDLITPDQEALLETYQVGNNFTLATGSGVCEDYADLFQDLCLRAGIPTIQTAGNNHAWNMVYVDGEWLYVDTTWDDPVGGKPVLRHDYFLVGPERMAVDHYWEGDDYPMPASYDPAWEQLDPWNITSADMYRKCLVAQVRQGKTSFSLRPVVRGAYGGSACLHNYNYELTWYQGRSHYNSSTGAYDYQIMY